jgi:alkylated DNA repair protein (DNA oxidative demethylase)
MRNLSQYQNLIYQPNYVTKNQKSEILKYLSTLYPIWEMRFSKSNPPPQGEANRQLLRPVYWLGNWQFACLNYYHPPQGINNRCVTGEEYPSVIGRMVYEIEQMVHQKFSPKDIPDRWHLNTCLINYYGNKIIFSDDQNNAASKNEKIDCARVGEHKDFEPGPVASISFGEKALFQFVKSAGKSQKSEVILQQWLEDSSLQIFGGDKFKKQLFHRVQRVEEKGIVFQNLNTTNFETRRINFTFRYVPTEHIRRYQTFPEQLKEDVMLYMKNLATHSDYWAAELTKSDKSPS